MRSSDSAERNLVSFATVTIALELALAPPHRRASIRTLHGPLWARCNLGSDFKPGSITVVMNPGCWGAAIYRAISKDRPVFRSHPNKAVDVVTNQPPRNKSSFSSDQNRYLFRSHRARLCSDGLRWLRDRTVAEGLIDLAARPKPM